jgi:hypothetical protein
VTDEVGAVKKFDGSDEWADSFLVLRYRRDFKERWFGTVLFDVVGFVSESDSRWQVFVAAGYRFNDRLMLQTGYRYLEYEIAQTDFLLSGPIVGVAYRYLAGRP